MASQLASGSNVHECSDAPPNLFPASISHKTGRLGNLWAQARTQRLYKANTFNPRPQYLVYSYIFLRCRELLLIYGVQVAVYQEEGGPLELAVRTFIMRHCDHCRDRDCRVPHTAAGW